MLGISLISINLMVGRIYSNLESYRITKRLDTMQYVYYQPENKRMTEFAKQMWEDTRNNDISSTKEPNDENTFEDILLHLENVEDISKLYYYSGETNSNQIDAYDNFLSVCATDDFLVPALSFQLLSGEWYNSALKDNAVDVVISETRNKLRIGDTFVVNFTDSPEDLGISVTMRVKGILRSPVYYLSYGASGDELCSLDLIEYFNTDSEERPLILCSQSALVAYLNKSGISSDNCIILFEKGITQEAFQNNLTYLSDYGYVATKQDLKQNTIEQIRISLYQYFPLSLFLLLIGVIGLMSVTILNIIYYRKHFAIFFICGCKWKQCIQINLFYILYAVVFAFLILTGYYKMFGEYNHLRFMVISHYNMWSTAFVCALIIGASALAPYILMRKLTPKEIMTAESDE